MRQLVLDRIQAAGITWVRIDVGWASMENGRDQISVWYQSVVDACVNSASQRGIDVLVTLHMTPAWANSGRGTCTPPDDMSDFAWFANYIADRYSGQVQGIEMWNEPDPTQASWCGTTQQYVDLLKAGYAGVKAASPSTLVVFGGPAGVNTNWISKCYQDGAGGAFDVMAVHPYMAPSDLPPETPDDGTPYHMTHVAAVHRLMVAWGDGTKPIWFTEFGWSSHANTGSEANWEIGVTKETQADYLKRSFQMVQADFPYVGAMFWYNEMNTTISTVQNDNYGLMYADGGPKPAYSAYQAWNASQDG